MVKPWDGVLLEVKNRPKEFGALDLGKTLIHFSKKKKSNASSKAFAPTNTTRGNCKKNIYIYGKMSVVTMHKRSSVGLGKFMCKS